MKKKWLCIILFTLLLGIGFSHISIANQLPVIKDNGNLISLQQEKVIGQLVAGKLNRLPESTVLVQKLWLKDLIQPLINHSQLHDKTLFIFLVYDKTINAFAAPGGVIGVHSGLILKIPDVEALSAVLAHEIAHISQRHYAHRLASQEQSSPAYIAAIVASLVVATNVDAELGMAGVQATINTLIHTNMAYSRAHEGEADRMGFDLMQSSGLDGGKMLNMLSHLDSPFIKQDPNWAWARSHPYAKERIADLTLRVQNSHSKDSFPDQYQIDYQLLRLMLTAQLLDPTHTNIATLSESIGNAGPHYTLYKAFADGLISMHKKQWQKAQSIFSKLSQQHPHNTFIWDQWMQSLLQQGRYAEIIEQSRIRLTMAIGIDMALYYLAQSHAKLNNIPKALSYLKKLIKRQPDWIGGWSMLSEWTAESGQLIEHRLAKVQWHLLRAEVEFSRQQLLLLDVDQLSEEQRATIQQITKQLDGIKALAR